jgi:hypothetical protein
MQSTVWAQLARVAFVIGVERHILTIVASSFLWSSR